MIIYAKKNVKAKKVAARIFIREDGIVLRLFFSAAAVDGARDFIEAAPAYIRDVFLAGHGDCHHCAGKVSCHFRKCYTLCGQQIEKCSGVAFEFWEPTMEKLADYVALMRAVYGKKR